eukprot:1161664-Pelagomonas_calceolata.AAC.19
MQLIADSSPGRRRSKRRGLVAWRRASKHCVSAPVVSNNQVTQSSMLRWLGGMAGSIDALRLCLMC